MTVNVILGMLIVIPMGLALVFGFYSYAVRKRRRSVGTAAGISDSASEVRSYYDRIDRMAS